MNKKFQAYAVTMVLLGALVSACNTIDILNKGQDANANLLIFDEQALDRIAHNFIQTLKQLDGLSPIPTTIQMMAPSTPFGRAIEHQVIETGYGHQLVEGDMGKYFLHYRVESAATQPGSTRLFKLRIGTIALAREFQVIDGHLTPVSAMRISGTASNDVNLDDDIFRFNNPNEFESEVEAVDEKESSVTEFEDKARLPVPFASNTNRPTQPPPESEDTRQIPPSSAVSAIANVFQTGISNYEDIFKGLTDQREERLPFNTNSYILSFRNWGVMESMIDEFEPVSDVFSVVGCSLGKTFSDEDNARLARNRTKRVKDALVRGGVSVDKIYAESCWGQEYRDNQLPRSGVVLKLKRRPV